MPEIESITSHLQSFCHLTTHTLPAYNEKAPAVAVLIKDVICVRVMADNLAFSGL